MAPGVSMLLVEYFLPKSIFYIYSFEWGKASFDTRSPVVLFVQEQLPFRDAVGVAEWKLFLNE